MNFLRDQWRRTALHRYLHRYVAALVLALSIQAIIGA
jgi:hypothetical protein